MIKSNIVRFVIPLLHAGHWRGLTGVSLCHYCGEYAATPSIHGKYSRLRPPSLGAQLRNLHAQHRFIATFPLALLTLVIALLLCTTSTRANAQVTGTWTCGSSTQCGTVMGAMTGERSFSTSEECEAWGQTNIPGGYSCTGGGGTFRISGVDAITALLQMGVIGAVGAGGGSMVGHQNGEAMTFEGGYGALAAMGVASMLANRSNRSLLGGLFIGAATGASAITAVNLYKQNDEKTEATAAVEYTDKIRKDATTGAAIGAGASVLMKALPGNLLNKLPPVRWLRRTSRPLSLINRGPNVGVRIEW